MAERPVVNTSPCIFLVRAGLLDLLLELGERVVVPAAVLRELDDFGPADPVAEALRRTSWIEIAHEIPLPATILAWDLGAGESAVLAWGLAHPGTELVIDDLEGRRCADALGLPHRGTLGLVLLARRRDRIPAARPVIESMRRAGMYLSDAVVDAALKLVGE